MCFCVLAIGPVAAQPSNEAQALEAIKLATNPTTKLAAAEDFVARFPKSNERIRIAELIAGEILKIKDGAVALALLDRAKAVFTSEQEREILKPVSLEAFAIGGRADDAFALAGEMLAKNPDDLHVLVRMTNAGAEETRKKNRKYTDVSLQYGLKAIAIYRDNCKVAQPLSKKGEAAAAIPPEPRFQRRRLPNDRTEIGRKFQVGEYEGYIHVGLYDDGTPGDIFVDIAKEGTTLAGLMNSFMISVSLGLQYGVPLEVYVSKFSHMRFEPAGMTNDADIRVAKSIVDYILRCMGKRFLSADQQEEAGILTPEVKARLSAAYNDAGEHAAAAVAIDAAPPGQTALFNQWEDAVECARCGGRMVRTGSCYTCRDCGTNTGCS